MSYIFLNRQVQRLTIQVTGPTTYEKSVGITFLMKIDISRLPKLAFDIGTWLFFFFKSVSASAIENPISVDL